MGSDQRDTALLGWDWWSQLDVEVLVAGTDGRGETQVVMLRRWMRGREAAEKDGLAGCWGRGGREKQG